MKSRVRWLAMGWVALMAVGCGKQEAQVVQPKLESKDVAIWVDNVGILQSQVQREVARLYDNVPKDTPQEQIPMIRARTVSQAVDNLVVRQLVRAEMERSGVIITGEELEEGKKNLEKGLGEGYSLAMLLAAADLSIEELEENLRLDLFKNKVLKPRIQAAIEGITEERLKAYYEENPQEFSVQEGRRAAHILVRAPADAPEAVKADARAKAEGIRKSLLEGADFATLARQESQCISRSRGGNLGVIPRGREAPAFEEAVFSQEIDAIGEVVETPVGFHVVKVLGDQEARTLSYEEVRDRLELMLRTQAQQQATADYIKELRDQATIKLEGALAELAAATEAARNDARKAAEAAVSQSEPAAPAVEP
jgi:peptidyl-prolyl cis-trans isomerase C